MYLIWIDSGAFWRAVLIIFIPFGASDDSWSFIFAFNFFSFILSFASFMRVIGFLMRLFAFSGSFVIVWRNSKRVGNFFEMSCFNDSVCFSDNLVFFANSFIRD